MSKIFLLNLGMIVTNKCNIDCAHCLRGCKNDKDMSKEVIQKTFNQIYGIGALSICGGEPTLALNPIKNIINSMMENYVRMGDIAVVINGTNYSEEFLRILKYADAYLKHFSKINKVLLFISYDQYHIEELIKYGLLDLYKENIEKYKESEFFCGFRQLDNNLKLYREGNAVNLDNNLTIDYRPMDILATYTGKDDRKMCSIGPIITVNTDGIITECDASIENQEKLFNYGNVFDNTFEEVALGKGKVVTPRQFRKQTKKTIKKHLTYNK